MAAATISVVKFVVEASGEKRQYRRRRDPIVVRGAGACGAPLFSQIGVERNGGGGVD